MHLSAVGLVAPALAPGDLVPAVEATIPDAKRLIARCVQAGIHATLGRTATCAAGGCSPRAQLMVRREDVPRVMALLEREWLDTAVREGTISHEFVEKMKDALSDPKGDPPCPACATAAPLVNGACSDCGLQLE